MKGKKIVYYRYQGSLMKDRQTSFTYYGYQDSLMKGKTTGNMSYPNFWPKTLHSYTLWSKILSDFSKKNSAERYFKIPHFRFVLGPVFLFYYYFFIYFIFILISFYFILFPSFILFLFCFLGYFLFYYLEYVQK